MHAATHTHSMLTPPLSNRILASQRAAAIRATVHTNARDTLHFGANIGFGFDGPAARQRNAPGPAAFARQPEANRGEKAMSQATTTTDHDEIRRWAEERGGRPSVVRTGQGEGGILRFDFGEDDEKLEETSWEEFFKIFDDNKLALLHQDEAGAGGTSRFFKFVAREAESGAAPSGARGRRGARRATARTSTARRATGRAKTAARRGAKAASKRGSKQRAAAKRAGAGATKRASATKRGAGTKRAAAKAGGRAASKSTGKGAASKRGAAAGKRGSKSAAKRGSKTAAKSGAKRAAKGGRSSRGGAKAGARKAAARK
jgi:hypothetical protein